MTVDVDFLTTDRRVLQRILKLSAAVREGLSTGAHYIY